MGDPRELPSIPWPTWGGTEGGKATRTGLWVYALTRFLGQCFGRFVVACGVALGVALVLRFALTIQVPSVAAVVRNPTTQGGRLLLFVGLGVFGCSVAVLAVLIVCTVVRVLVGARGYEGMFRASRKRQRWRQRWLELEAASRTLTEQELQRAEGDMEAHFDVQALTNLALSTSTPLWPIKKEVKLDGFKQEATALPSVKPEERGAAGRSYLVGLLLHSFSRWPCTTGGSLTAKNGEGIIHVRSLVASPDVGVTLVVSVGVEQSGNFPMLRTNMGTLWWTNRVLLSDEAYDEGHFERTRKRILKDAVPGGCSLYLLPPSLQTYFRFYRPKGGLGDVFLGHWSPSFGDIGDAMAIGAAREQNWPKLHNHIQGLVHAEEQLVRSIVDSVGLSFRQAFIEQSETVA